MGLCEGGEEALAIITAIVYRYKLTLLSVELKGSAKAAKLAAWKVDW